LDAVRLDLGYSLQRTLSGSYQSAREQLGYSEDWILDENLDPPRLGMGYSLRLPMEASVEDARQQLGAWT